MGKLYAGLGAAAVLALMAWGLLHSRERIGDLESQLRAQASETSECVRANRSNVTTITELEETIEEMREGIRIARERVERMVREREVELQQAREEARRLEEEREDEAETVVECGEFNEIVVSGVCPATARQLRERSRSPGGHGDEDRREGG